MAVGPDGLRVAVISAGTSSLSAGLTLMDAALPPAGSSVGYLNAPNDTYGERGFTFRQRYRPRAIGALYGQ